uniref:Rhodanese domain-containing protein n=1 Tax=Hemiselmis andersenii TaxID=464988 RepID=A0A6T8KDW4_HEMAN|mmetsp:Transcript_2905/g.6952  ORF Transcript_2905/g.6952 Transcript_2905/m.6952 type:complete len:180 (+) Transcript_2905:92-631(+)
MQKTLTFAFLFTLIHSNNIASISAFGTLAGFTASSSLLRPSLRGSPGERPRGSPRLGLSMAEKFTTVPAAEAYEKIKTEKYVYVDVRTPGEYETASVPDSVLIPAFEKSATGMSPVEATFKEEFQKMFPDKDSKLVISCASGKRSNVACGWLTELGYSNLVEVQGGFGGWSANKDLPSQ